MEQWQPRLTARRMMRDEYQKIREMYHNMGRDGEWLTEMTEDEMDDAGEWWGLYCDEAPVLCCAVARPRPKCHADSRALRCTENPS